VVLHACVNIGDQIQQIATDRFPGRPPWSFHYMSFDCVDQRRFASTTTSHVPWMRSAARSSIVIID